MSRKNLSGLGERDILCKWLYTNKDGIDIFALHNVINYNVTSQPLGILTLRPDGSEVSVELSINPEDST